MTAGGRQLVPVLTEGVCNKREGKASACCAWACCAVLRVQVVVVPTRVNVNLKAATVEDLVARFKEPPAQQPPPLASPGSPPRPAARRHSPVSRHCRLSQSSPILLSPAQPQDIFLPNQKHSNVVLCVVWTLLWCNPVLNCRAFFTSHIGIKKPLQP